LGLHRADYFWLVDDIVKDVGLSADSGALAKEILMDARRFRLTGGHHPSSLAAAALYIACVYRCERVTQSRLAESCGIAEVSVRVNYRRLLRRLNACLPVKFVDYYRKWCPVESLSNVWLSQWRRAWEREFFEDEVEVTKSKKEKA
jgi:hypothetical protein